MESSFAISENTILRLTLPQCPFQALTHQTLLHLAARRAWIVVDFEQNLRPFLPCYPVPAEMRTDLVEARQGVPGPEPQHGGDALAEGCVGCCDHHCLGDPGHLQQHLFD